MYQTLRTTIWFLLIGAGVLTVLLTWTLSTDVRALLAMAGVICVWIAWGIISSWLFGLRRRVTAHMRRPIDKVTFVSKDVGSSRIADYVRTFEHLYESQPGTRLGADAAANLSHLKAAEIALQRVDWNTIEGEDESLVSVPTNSVYLLQHEGVPFVAKLSTNRRVDMYEHEDAWATGKGESMEICAESLGQANVVIRWLSSQTSRHSIYRGQLLQVASPQDGTLGQTIRMFRPPSADRDSIVLPDSVMTLLERMVHFRYKHQERLAKFGHKTKLGILLHGAPGTGKTLVTKYLIGSCQRHTVVVPTDMAVETLRESFRLAIYLQPSILVLEDVDLLAPNRELGRNVDGLQELMNEMDGLGPECDTIVIMSTNRPEILEPALASRPGRVSQAVEFALPDEDARQRLLRLFLRDACSGSLLISEWAKRTSGASPAFLEELCKRAILLASERSETSSEIPDSDELPLDVQHDDLDEAIHELVVMGGTLTRSVLGFPDLTNA